MKKILWMILIIITTLSSCRRDDENESGSGTSSPGETAYLSLNLSGVEQAGSRAGTNPGTAAGEDDVNDISILLFDANNKFLDIKTFLKDDLIKANSSYQTNPFLVSAATKKVFVVVNNKEADGVSPRFTMPTQANDVGKNWSEINQTLLYTPSPLDDVNGFITKITGKTTVGSHDNYTMANFGLRAPGDNGLLAVTIGKTPAEATAGANTIYVDRLASKIGFKIAEIGFAGSGELAALPANAKFFFQAWQLNATNRKIRLYSPHTAGYTGTPDPTGSLAGMVAYREDANFTIGSYGMSGSLWTGFESQFVFLRNIGTNGQGATSLVDAAAGTFKYCPENTMEGNAQLVGATTKVVIKGNYVPASSKTGRNFVADESYFSYAGEYYTLSELQAAYLLSAANGHGQGLAKDMDAFMKAALFMMGAANPANPTDAEYEAAVAALTVSSFDVDKGIIARLSNAVRYFHKGVSYYSVLIRHDQRITDNMMLGKYGTVRNNWYELTLNKVSKPGTPWIPGGPDDPTTNPETPDDADYSLDVTITINPWITWQQGIEL